MLINRFVSFANDLYVRASVVPCMFALIFVRFLCRWVSVEVFSTRFLRNSERASNVRRKFRANCAFRHRNFLIIQFKRIPRPVDVLYRLTRIVTNRMNWPNERGGNRSNSIHRVMRNACFIFRGIEDPILRNSRTTHAIIYSNANPRRINADSMIFQLLRRPGNFHSGNLRYSLARAIKRFLVFYVNRVAFRGIYRRINRPTDYLPN